MQMSEYFPNKRRNIYGYPKFLNIKRTDYFLEENEIIKARSK